MKAYIFEANADCIFETYTIIANSKEEAIAILLKEDLVLPIDKYIYRESKPLVIGVVSTACYIE